ncbi:restriction endonuclease subunit S [Streptococcus thermophilus]|nr:restriction endonuclease subunit S [Streptococcus thermophilus]MCE2293313.1 restriction endonuclease subunit S [Streptococcus thermophilus]MCE2296666.1 restriction endonuclease subunit S [Streptococcus thermophilus]MCE2316893.1 restriction endonuclease subunit S [Streptococcus thermophilus]
MQMNIEWKILMNSFKVPRIRFKEFDVIWVEKRIADIVKISAGGDVDKIKLKESGKYPVVANALTNKGIVGFYDDYKVKAPAVTVTGRGDVGYAVARHENFTPIVRLLTLQSENIDVDYLENQINSMRILNESTGVPQLTAPQLGNYKVYHPEIDEQTAIGSLFRTLDDLLTSYKDNLANYQSLKATMLSKMFPKVGHTAPEIRLDGFDGEWKKSKLRDVSERVQGNDGRMDLPTLTISASGGWMNQIERFSANIAGKEQKNYTLLKKGELSYNHGNSKLAKYGVVFELQDYEEALVPKVYHSFRVNQLADAKFIEIMFSSKIPDRELGKLVSSGARMDGLLNISFDDFMNIAIIIPTIEEQQAIGSYFSKLDQLITSYREKITQLETLKKKLLQDMFI